jgi:dTDP-4-dehydrorhamnose 3,5-epimerase
MKFEHTIFKHALLIKPEQFIDHRGKYVETFNWNEHSQLFLEQKIPYINFVQDDFSYSHHNVLRGMHGDQNTWKLVSCVLGQFRLVIVDCDKDSDTYKKYQEFVLDETDNYQVLIPPKFANGHYCISDRCIFHYKQSTFYESRSQFTVAWNDSSLNINWKIPTSPSLSIRDSEGPFLKLI